MSVRAIERESGTAEKDEFWKKFMKFSFAQDGESCFKFFLS